MLLVKIVGLGVLEFHTEIRIRSIPINSQQPLQCSRNRPSFHSNDLIETINILSKTHLNQRNEK